MTESRAGLFYGLSAFLIWGLVPLYFSLLRRVSALEIIAHRVLWSVVLLSLLLRLSRGFDAFRALARAPRRVAGLALSAALVTGNWLTFVWAVNAGRVLETSLGYFITPQVNILLGFVFLGERLRPAQWLAVALAVAGVANQVALLGQLPWISLVLAATFGSYGLLRKRIAIDPLTGLFVETLLAAPAAIAYLVFLSATGQLVFGHAGRGLDLLLVLLGVVTAVPLMCFAAGAQRLRLVTIGFLQYLAPTMTFLLAVFVYGEPLGWARGLTFVFIWAGIIIYMVEGVRAARRR